MKKSAIVFLVCLSTVSLAQNRKRKDYLVSLNTDFGTMRLLLYDQTPKHKENFIKLVSQKFYDSLLFHRIIQDFMIQGGDPNSRKAPMDEPLGNGDIGYTIPAEISPALFHKKGALAAARDNNPEKASSGCQFYVVQGRIWTDDELSAQITKGVSRGGRKPTDEQKRVYKTLGGTPHLDGNYTVFGEVIDGLAVVDSLAKQPRDAQDRPRKNLRMTMTGEWLKRKKITKQYGYQYL